MLWRRKSIPQPKRAHGSFSIIPEHLHINTCLEGCFNLEGMHSYIKTMKRAVLSHDCKPVKLLIESSRLEGATPDAVGLLHDYNLWLSKSTQVYKAFVGISPSLQYLLMFKLPQLESVHMGFFKTREEALRWLGNQQEHDLRSDT